MGLRARLLLLVSLPLIPALIMALFINFDQRRLGAFKVEKDAIRVGQLAAATELGLIEATRQHLSALARLPQARGSNFGEYAKFFAGMTQVYPEYTDFGLVETNGEVVSRSFAYKERTNLAERPDFQRVLQSRDFAIGEYREGNGTNKASLWFGHPVFDDKGRFVRILYAALNLETLKNGILKAELPAGGVIGIFDRSGHLLAHSLEERTWVGRSFSGSTLLNTMMSKVEGTAQMRGLDNVPRLYAFTPIRNGSEANLFVSVGIPLSLAFADVTRILVRNLAVLMVVAGAALLAARLYANRYILAPVKALAASTEKVASGDLSARTGITGNSGELNQLAKAFDDMTEGLQRQRMQTLQAEKNILELNAQLEQRVQERTRELEKSNKEMEAFSYSVSHDLRAPLRHIGGFVQILQEELEPVLTAETRSHLTLVRKVSLEMGELIDNLLSFSGLGRAEMCRSQIRMDTLVQQALDDLDSEQKGRSIAWKIGKLPEVFGDAGMLKQVWINLLSNAIKYTRGREHAEIRISFQRQNGETEFRVEDNGAGFDMEYASKLFGVFQRLHHKEQFEGTGIGLALVRRIIERHGGRTWAEGKVNAGAIFYFTLPVVEVA